MSDQTEDTVREVLHFWFEETPAAKRFARDEALDGEISRRFGTLHDELERYLPAAWHQTKEARLASVVVLDQFSRNLYRGDARAYASDDQALAVTEEALRRGDFGAWDAEHAHMLVMPLMHAEDLERVRRSTKLLEEKGLSEAAQYGRRHEKVIERFGRYPARNRALGRASTAGEEAFLEENPSGF